MPCSNGSPNNKNTDIFMDRSEIQLLFIAYHFPPQGGGGVQRSLKFSKYLPKFGIRPSILTTDKSPNGQWTPPDPTLNSELHKNATLFRVPWPFRTQKKVNIFDPSKAESIVTNTPLRHQALDLILVSASPFSDLEFARYLAKRLSIPWIADLRDPWALDEFQIRQSRWHRRSLLKRMRQSLAGAAHIIMNTPEAERRLLSSFPEFNAEDVSSITNGYDAEDFNVTESALRTKSFNIVHAGSLHTISGIRQKRRRIEYSLLGRTERGMQSLPRSHYYLLQALTVVLQKRPTAVKNLRLLLAGALNETDLQEIENHKLSNIVIPLGYLNHSQSIQTIKNANLLFLPMHSLNHCERSSIVPGKAYEYMATGNRILAAVPDGDAKDFLLQCGTASLCNPTDVSSMVKDILAQYDSWHNQQPTPIPNWSFIKNFERTQLTAKLANVIKKVVHS